MPTTEISRSVSMSASLRELYNWQTDDFFMGVDLDAEAYYNNDTSPVLMTWSGLPVGHQIVISYYSELGWSPTGYHSGGGSGEIRLDAVIDPLLLAGTVGAKIELRNGELEYVALPGDFTVTFTGEGLEYATIGIDEQPTEAYRTVSPDFPDGEDSPWVAPAPESCHESPWGATFVGLASEDYDTPDPYNPPDFGYPKKTYTLSLYQYPPLENITGRIHMARRRFVSS